MLYNTLIYEKIYKGGGAIAMSILFGLIGWAFYAGKYLVASGIFFLLAAIAFLVGFIKWMANL